MELPLSDKLFSSTEVCNILGVSLRTLYRYIESGDLGSIQTPTGRHRFTKRHIEDFLGKGRRVKDIFEENAKIARARKEEMAEIENVEEEKVVTPSVYEEEQKEPFEDKQLGGISLDYEEGESKVSEELPKEELVEEAFEIYYKCDSPDVRTMARKIKEIGDKYSVKYAFSSLGGLSLHYPIKPFSNLGIYVEKENLAIWVSELGLEETSKLSANLKIKFDLTVLESAKFLGGLYIANDKTLAEDLEEEGYSDLAEEFRAKTSK